jgi:serine/threonine-protein kinase
VAAVVVLAGSFGVGYLLATQVIFPRPETAGAGVPLPALYGLDRAAAEAALRKAGLEVGEVATLPSMEAAPGRVLAQDPVPGQQLRRGAAASFVVSSGPPELGVPPLAGLGVSAARELLESVGFAVEVQQVRSASDPVGRVVRSEPPAGTRHRLPAVIRLVVSSGPLVDSAGGSGDGGGIR